MNTKLLFETEPGDLTQRRKEKSDRLLSNQA